MPEIDRTTETTCMVQGLELASTAPSLKTQHN